MSASTRTELERRLDPLRDPFRDFITAQTTAAAVLLLAMVSALLLFNFGGAAWYAWLQNLPVGFHAGKWQFSFSLLSLTNDGLIAIFFFLIGLEIKRELLAGELQDNSRRGMLMASAFGGMLMPALIYAGINLWSGAGAVEGWGIPMATDTALAIGVLAALGTRLVPGAAAFLVGLAIVDDIGAVTVIALFYTQAIHGFSLLSAVVLLAIMFLINYAGIRHPLVYASLGALLWLAVHHSGIHASIAGVLIAATVPARPRMPPGRLLHSLQKRMSAIHPHADVLAYSEDHEKIESVALEAREATTPLRRWERALDLPVALIILPLFAFLNAGASMQTGRLSESLHDPVALGVALGLLFGKPLGIISFALVAKRLGFGCLPEGVSYRHLIGLGMLAGIGFTMSTFIADLALPEHRLELAKIAILCASALAGMLGYLMLRFSVRD